MLRMCITAKGRELLNNSQHGDIRELRIHVTDPYKLTEDDAEFTECFTQDISFGAPSDTTMAILVEGRLGVDGRVMPIDEATEHIRHSLKVREEVTELYHWPYCQVCREPFEFEAEEPFAYCGCGGATEWGSPRPAPWIPKPSKS